MVHPSHRHAFKETLLILVLALASGGGSSLPLAQETATPASTTTPATGKSSIKGQVLGEDGKAASGGRVRLALMDSDDVLEAEIQSDGSFLFESLPHGYYRLVFEVEDGAFPSNRILLVPPKEKVKATFQLGGFLPEDRNLGFAPDQPAPLAGGKTRGVAHLLEKTGPGGWAWFRTGKGVAVLIGGGTLLVAGLIALTSSEESIVSPSSP